MIEVKNLTKKYAANTAVSDISFTIEEGKVYGLLGPNGAGKSTTMNIITGALAASDGVVTVDGLDILDDAKEAKKHIGYLPEIPPLYPDMTPDEYLSFIAKAKGIKNGEIQDEIARVMEETQITDVSDRIIKNLSKGYKQRVGIAQAMLGNPSYIILDEPTVGLDPLQIIEIRKLIRSLATDRTVILSSHILAEVQEVCDEIIIISHGKIAACGTEDELREKMTGPNVLTVTTKAECDPGAQVFDGISGITEISEADEKDGEKTYTVYYEKNSDIRENVYNAFVKNNAVLLALTSKVPTLEDLFLELTKDEEEIPFETASPVMEEIVNAITDREEISEEEMSAEENLNEETDGEEDK